MKGIGNGKEKMLFHNLIDELINFKKYSNSSKDGGC
jgi:hypothetical protein